MQSEQNKKKMEVERGGQQGNRDFPAGLSPGEKSNSVDVALELNLNFVELECENIVRRRGLTAPSPDPGLVPCLAHSRWQISTYDGCDARFV